MKTNKFLNEKCKEIGLSSKEFAKLVGISEIYARQLLAPNSKKLPSDETAVRIVKALKLSTDEEKEFWKLLKEDREEIGQEPPPFPPPAPPSEIEGIKREIKEIKVDVKILEERIEADEEGLEEVKEKLEEVEKVIIILKESQENLKDKMEVLKDKVEGINEKVENNEKILEEIKEKLESFNLEKIKKELSTFKWILAGFGVGFFIILIIVFYLIFGLPIE